MGVLVEVDLLEVRSPGLRQHLLAGAGLADLALEDLADRRALRAAVARVAAGDDVGRDAALPVGRPGERDERPLAGDEVLHLDRVADGEDVRVARAHVLVHADAAALADLEAGRLRERGLRPHADGEDDDVGRVRLAGLGQHLERAVGGLPEPGHAVVELEMHAVLHQVALDQARHLGVERRHHLVELLDERHLEPEVGEVLHHLEADEPAADHDRPLRLRHGLEPGVRVHPGLGFVAALEPLADRPGVGHGPHREDARQVDAGRGGRIGAAPGDSTSLS